MVNPMAKHAVITWAHKDANRRWWRVVASDMGIPIESEHKEWKYKVLREDEGGMFIEVHTSYLMGQYEEPPSLLDFLKDYLQSVSCTMMGFAGDNPKPYPKLKRKA